MEKFLGEAKSFVLAGSFGLGVGLIILADSNIVTALVGVGTCVFSVLIFWLLVRFSHFWIDKLTEQSGSKTGGGIREIFMKTLKMLRKYPITVILSFIVGAFSYTYFTATPNYQAVPNCFKDIEFGSNIEGVSGFLPAMKFEDGSIAWTRVGFECTYFEGREAREVYYFSYKGGFCAAVAKFGSYDDYVSLLRVFRKKYGDEKKTDSDLLVGSTLGKHRWVGESVLVLELKLGDGCAIYNYKKEICEEFTLPKLLDKRRKSKTLSSISF